MSRHASNILTAVLLAAVAILVLPSLAEDNTGIRIWASKKGAKVEAEFVALEYGLVRLKKASGSPIKIRLIELIDSDQQIARELAGEDEPVANTSTGYKKLGHKKKAGDPRLTEEELDELVVEADGKKPGQVLHLTTGFTQVRLDPEKHRSEIRKYSNNGRIPYRITADLNLLVDKRAIRIKERAQVYVICDDDDEVVFSKKMSLLKLCPS